MNDPVPALTTLFFLLWIATFVMWRVRVSAKVVLFLLSLLLLAFWKVLAVYVRYGIAHTVYPYVAIVVFVIAVLKYHHENYGKDRLNDSREEDLTAAGPSDKAHTSARGSTTA